ncbi:hypothetical protein LTS18_009507 [Coniosporium uncinatum]|uniref:Uncharacterized protein n=1 Tax=Coniosporium uncinatum TaxID=93489 RepID=A0ACC3DWK4_9PEZI|nr:hypothetical protein LTS18_009507 [Coniosporium uncinatum]
MQTTLPLDILSHYYKLHFLIPATHNDPNLCKTLLSSSVLGYPNPTIVAWKEGTGQQNALGGGSHLAKISKTLEYLNSLGPDQDDELVLMIDGYDIWFQLPFDVMIRTYYRAKERADARLRSRLGRAADIEGIRQDIIFGAGKRCAPNLLWSIACYPRKRPGLVSRRDMSA